MNTIINQGKYKKVMKPNLTQTKIKNQNFYTGGTNPSTYLSVQSLYFSFFTPCQNTIPTGIDVNKL
jgi:hypothetical protein